jgi:hypothetical protein
MNHRIELILHIANATSPSKNKTIA